MNPISIESHKQDAGNYLGKKRILVLVFYRLICVLIDQITKAIAATQLPHITLHYLGDTIRLHYTENQGAFLSLGANLPENLRFLLFTVFSSIILLALFVYIVIYEKEMPFSHLIVWSIMFGGGISNLIDRIFRNGLVRDFLNFGLGNLRTGVLNLADIFLTGGVVAAILQNLWMLKGEKQSGDKTDTAHIE